LWPALFSMEATAEWGLASVFIPPFRDALPAHLARCRTVIGKSANRSRGHPIGTLGTQIAIF